MTAMQKTVIGGALAAAVGIGFYEARQNSRLRGKVQSLQEAQAQLADQFAQASREKEHLSNLVARAQKPDTQKLAGLPKEQFSELLKLRGMANLNAREIEQLKAALTDQKGKIPESVATVMRKHLDGAAGALRRAQTNAAFARTGRMSEKLKLTPEQEEQVRAIFAGNPAARGDAELAHETRSFFEDEPNNPMNKITATEDRALSAVLTPSQMADYAQMKTDEDNAGAQRYVGYETSTMKRALGLSDQQAEQLASIFATLKRGEGGPGITYYSNAREQLDTRLRAFEAALTPDQLEKYRQMKLEDIENHDAIRKIVTALKQ